MTDTRPVVVVTDIYDVTADCVIAELNTRHVPVVRLDPGCIGSGLDLSAHLGSAPLTGALTTGTRELDLTAARSLYWRRPSSPPYENLTENNARFARAEARRGLGGVLENLPACLYVNHPQANRRAESKVAQLCLAQQLGMNVPSTLVTNKLHEAQRFVDEHEGVIYKSLSNIDYARDGQAHTVWTETVDCDDLNEDIGVTTHLFQEKVTKIADWRITVVGSEVFCVQIDHPEMVLDWRSDYEALSYTAVTPPHELVTQLQQFLTHFGLVFGCFDFGVTAEGRAVFFECNPNGQWAWTEPDTKLPMTAAFADILQKGKQNI